MTMGNGCGIIDVMSEDIEKNTNGTKQNTEQSVEQSVVQNAAGGNLSQAMSAPTGEVQRRKETTLIAVIII